MPVTKLKKKTKAATATKAAEKKPSGAYTGYCVKCKEKEVVLTDPIVEEMKNGRQIAKGKHDKCGTTVCRILGKDA